MYGKNAVFNPTIYEKLYGEIETFDPAAYSREKARERAFKNLEYKKLKKQKRLGIFSILAGALCVLAGLSIQEMYTIAIPFFIVGIGLLKTKEIVVD